MRANDCLFLLRKLASPRVTAGLEFYFYSPHSYLSLEQDEQEMVEARKQFYSNVGSGKVYLKTGEWIGKQGIPLFVVMFCAFYWGFGAGHYLFTVN